ncbi:MAG TPA: 3-hydroxyacyl-CoA dehydrogenase NAD-binding domain-containing protein [Gemmatimonadales bacterium]|nr:3-hydroxyacyl-CoA dehydrogenase NAD-binding domain-containing protein [Gemmatimonadales bacterium]
MGVLGAGTMGSGIAQVAAVAGHRVILQDVDDAAVARARAGIDKALARETEKKRLAPSAAEAARGRVQYVASGELSAFAPCQLVIEAIAERLGPKRESFAALERVVAPEAMLATNTSALSITSIAGACQRPERVIGLHFFNPAPVMSLVEVVPGYATPRALVDAACNLVQRWGKTTVVATDTPGFIVNRIARPFYGEALRILDEGIADCATIDWAMRTLGGFKMGPFELMDLIGNDVNLAVTSAVYEGFFFDPRYRPSLTQRRLVDANLLGRKTGRGYHDYRPGAVRAAPKEDEVLGRSILDRILAMLINEAVDAVFWGVATPADIDIAMVKGVNYPSGLIAWAEKLGYRVTLERVEALQAEYGEDRYRPSPLLRRLAASGGTLRG